MALHQVTNHEPASALFRAPAYGPPYHPFAVANRDTTNPVFYADHPGMINAESSTIDAQTYVVFDGSQDVWASTLNDAITVFVDIKYGVIAMGNVT